MNLKLIIITTLIVLTTIAGVWYVFIRPTSSLISTTPTSVDFGNADERPGVGGGVGSSTPTNTNEPFAPSGYTENDKIFGLQEGPIASAMLIQTLHPTTTLVRFIKADNGRVFDLPLDVPGALPRAVSNTTIPGLQRVWWVPLGVGALLQYESDGVRKTLYLGLLSATTTLNSGANPQPTKIQYLPDNISDLAVSPDGKQVTYLLITSSGADGYTAGIDGSAPKKLFSTPLSQVVISWPSPQMLLLQTKVGYGVMGAAFSVDVKTGSVSTLFFAQALQALADRAFSRVMYQTNLADGTRVSYVHDIVRNKDTGLSLSPIPEKCVFASAATSTLYCAAPMQYVPQNYLDLWHAGVGSAVDSLLTFDIATGGTFIVATPGTDGGAAADMVELSSSPDNHYLTYVRKGDRSLWGIRLKQ